MASLSITVIKLTVELVDENAHLVTTLADHNMLYLDLAYIKTGSEDRDNGGRVGRGERGNVDIVITFNKYCLTHGPTFVHTFKDCSRCSPGYKEDTTATDILRGRETKWKSRN